MSAQLTVRQLVALLAKQHPDALVMLEGCDCVGEAAGVESGEGDHEGPPLPLAWEKIPVTVDERLPPDAIAGRRSVLITRSKGDDHR